MALTISRASVVETTLGITFAIAELTTTQVGAVQVTNRAVPTYTITSAASHAVDAEILTVAALPVDLDAGTLLEFSGGTTATVADYVATGATSIPILPLDGAIGNAETATTIAWRFVAGCYNATVTPEIKNVDVTNYLSGVGMEQVTTGNSKKMSLEFNLVYGDQGGYILREIAYDAASVGKEFYFQLVFPSGEKHEGVALLLSASPTQGVQDKRSFQCEAQVQGSSYIYTAPTEIIA